jgi:uncharacterized protein involved in exopolysaccharide biosynthesis
MDVSVNPTTLSSSIESVADRKTDVSPRESLTRIFIRPWLFAICVLLPPVIAVGFATLVPTTYRASCKILIRYGASEAAFLRDLIPDNRAALSGLSSAEILRSMPSVLATVEAQNITDADIVSSPKDIVSGFITAHLSGLLPKSKDTTDGPTLSMPGVDPAKLRVAEAFKASLSDSTSGTSSKAVEVLDKGMSALPASQRGDDLITMTVPSFNRLKVAAMANGLAQSFIAEYARLSAEEAHRSVEFLDKLIAEAENNPLGLRLPDKTSAMGEQPNGDVYRRSPLLEHLANDLATRESTLAQLTSMYAPTSPQVLGARAAVDKLRGSLEVAEREEVQKLSLEQLRLRRYQAANTEQLFKDGLVPISIVEAAETPRKVSPVARYVVAGGVGLALGLMLGLSLIVVLSVSDQRLYTSWDVERTVKLPLLATLPVMRRSQSRGDLFTRFNDPEFEDSLIQLLSRLDVGRDRESAVVVAVASASSAEGRTFVVTGLAALLARGGRRKVLLIDADLRARALSIATGTNDAAGFIDAIRDATPFKGGALQTELPGVAVLPAGHGGRRAELGFYRGAFEDALNEVRHAYDFVLIDTTAVLAGIGLGDQRRHEPPPAGAGGSQQTRRRRPAAARRRPEPPAPIPALVRLAQCLAI